MNISLEVSINPETAAVSSRSGTRPLQRILVVEDDPAIRKLYAELLIGSGYRIDTAEDGVAAWKALQAGSRGSDGYDLLITDNNMPNLSGIELIKKLRSARMMLPVILASAIILTETSKQEPWFQTVTKLSKPFSMDELLATVKKSLRPSEAPRSAAFTVKQYLAEQKTAWDHFVNGAKNATFLFLRDYMDYHSDRFTDHSLMIFEDDELVGLIPANLAADGSLVSHEGLTYGGLMVARNAKLKNVLGCFHAVLSHLKAEGISQFFYRKIPSFYNTLPDDDVAYALFLLEAKLYRRDCAAVISEADRLPFRRGHKYLINKAAGLGVQIVQETSFQPFWEGVLIPQLQARYGAKPVHTLEEITGLAARFPENIKQFSAYHDGEIIAGTTIYETPTVAHTQYGAVTDAGRELGAQAQLLGWLIEQYKTKRFFDFGTSNEMEGRGLNHGLLDWKEGFGARCYTHDFFKISTANHAKLEALLQGHREIISPPAGKVPSISANGYDVKFIHPQAVVDEGALIGKGTRVWAFSHILGGATVGEDCNICDHTFIEGGVRMGDRVTAKCGVFLWDGLIIENDVFIGPSAVFTNDPRPRSKIHLTEYPKTVLKEGCSLGAHSTTLPGLTIGRWAMVGAGAVVTHDVPDFALVVGNPARFRAWICRCGEKLPSADGCRLSCHCGRLYEQVSENELKEVAVNDCQPNLPGNRIVTNLSDPVMQVRENLLK